MFMDTAELSYVKLEKLVLLDNVLFEHFPPVMAIWIFAEWNDTQATNLTPSCSWYQMDMCEQLPVSRWHFNPSIWFKYLWARCA